MSAVSEKKKKLTSKQRRFVDFYVTSANFNATKAHELAGYSAKNYDQRRKYASRLVTKEDVAAEIKHRLDEEHKDNLELKTKIRRKYEKLAFLSIDKLLKFGSRVVSGSIEESYVVLKNIEDIEDKYLDCIKKVKRTKDGYEVELYSAENAMTELRKMYGFDAPAKHELTGKDGKDLDLKPVVQLYLPENGRE